MEVRNSTQSPLVETLERIQVHDHLCRLYQTQEEQLATVVPFLRCGLERDERCLYVADDQTAATILEALGAAGVDTAAALGNGALQIACAGQTFLKQGRFYPEAMICLLEDAVRAAKEAGFAALRTAGEMSWALADGPGSDLLIDFEAKLNSFVADHDILALCQYHCQRFPSRFILDVIRTHPLVIHAGTVCHNAYYIPPEEFSHPNGSELAVHRLLCNLRHRQLADERLHDYVEQCQAILDTTCDGFLVVDEDGHILDVNNAYCGLSGYSRAELLHMNIAKLRVLETPAEVLACLGRIRAQGTGRFETRHRARDGRVFDVEISSTYFARGRRFVNFIRDVTERQQAEQQLRKSLRDIETLLKEVHHRVKNNLAIIVALLNLQCENIQDPACKEALRECQNRVYSMATVHQMLKQVQKLTGIDLVHYVHDLCQHLVGAYLKEADRVQLAIKVDPVPLGVDTAVPFGLILNELVSNALKHAFPLQRCGRLQVTVKAEAGGPVTLSVQDDGIGLPADLDFRQARSLGLRLVNNLARQIDGVVAVEKDKGTTVRVSFTPRAEVP